MNKHILKEDVQNYLKANREKSPVEIALKKSPFEHVSSAELASQIDGWQRSVRKLPTWANSEGIYYPDKINLEQCSSEHTALIKQLLIHKGTRVIDLTGGFSVDSCYMAQEASELIHCELNEKLSAIVHHNAAVLKVQNLICYAGDGIEVLRQSDDQAFDYIYVDPSRRINQGKVFLLAHCEPNLLEYQELFFQKSKYIISKLSPLLDISMALEQLSRVKYIYVISLDNDCKELLFIQDKDYSGQAKIRAIRLFQNQLQSFEFTYEEERGIISRFLKPQHYLYDPDVAIMKAGAFKSVGKQFGLGKLHQHSHLYTSEKLETDFPGRVFEIETVLSLTDFKKNNPWPQANVATRNFPEKVEIIKKKYKIKDGGKQYLFFTTDISNQLIVIAAKRIS
ncbi:THUMP-like domain-containing protein [Sphingobacterium sp. HJSM2_6]|uniref:THUMP-like domain-containing protein n=1 Tax=Sphingobacterium sp. HJSM2_6 TaxID=3366264 RepID=UPI003BBA2D12